MKIAIIGTCPSSKNLALQLPNDWALWVCSPGNDYYPRIDAWFELHCDLDFPGENFEAYLNWLNSQVFKVYAQRLDLIPKATLFPYEKLVADFGPYFFTSQLAWMMAFAITAGATDIGLFGLDMAARTEYSHQKPAIFHFTQIAEQHGIRVLVPPESDVLQPPPLYGYSFNSPMARKLRVRQCEIEREVSVMDAEIRRLELRRAHFKGVLDENDWAQQTWTGGVYKEKGEVVRLTAPKVQLVTEKEA